MTTSKSQQAVTLDQLVSAVISRDYVKIREINALGFDLRSTDDSGLCPMAKACLAGDLRSVEALATYCADFEAPTTDAAGALDHALACGNALIRDHLIRRGANVNARTVDGRTLLDRAILRSNLSDVKALALAGGLVSITDSDVVACTRILWPRLCQTTRSALANQICLRGSALPMFTTVDKLNYFELFARACKHRVRHQIAPRLFRRAKTFVKWFADHDTADLIQLSITQPPAIKSELEHYRNSVLRAAESYRKRHTHVYLQGDNALHQACAAGNTMFLHIICGTEICGELINRSNSMLMRPLHLATIAKSTEQAEVLLRAGADANCCDAAGRTPLHYAAASGDLELFRMLLRFGGNVMLGTRDGRSLKALVSDLPEQLRAEILDLQRRYALADRRFSIFSPDNPFKQIVRGKSSSKTL